MKPSPTPQCSTFALDVFWTSGRNGPPDLARHIDECDPCRAYLAMLDEVEASDLDEGATVIRPRARGVRHVRILAQTTAGLALAAGVALFVRNALEAPGTVYVGVKGTPSVQLLVHRGGETAIWDGRSPVHAGDAIAVRAACGDLANVSVATEDAARGEWTRLSDATCPKGDDPWKGPPGGDVLPFTLVVDGESSVERIAVVMSGTRLSDDELTRVAHDSERSARAWVVRFVIPEERP